MGMVHKPGEAPGPGAYACGRCGWPVKIVDDSVLPPCKVCGPTHDIRYFHEPQRPPPPESPSSAPNRSEVS